MVDCKIFRAIRGDEDIILNLLYPEYMNESTYRGLTYDREGSLNMIRGFIDNVCIVAVADGKAVGVLGMFVGRTYYKEIEADVDMFFVTPEYRGTGVSREIVKAAVDFADASDAKVMYSSCLSGIGKENEQLFVNLWKKFGFNHLGTVLIRSK